MTMTNAVTYTRPADAEAIMLEARRLRAEAVQRWALAAGRWVRRQLVASPQAHAA